MGVETAAQYQSVRVMLTAPCFKWSVRLDLHQHPAGYEPDALLLSYRPMKMVGYPGAAPGVSWSQTKRERLALSYPIYKMVPSAGSAPAPLRSQRRMLLLHYEGCVEMDPPVRFALT